MTLVVGVALDALVLLAMFGAVLVLVRAQRRSSAALIGLAAVWHLLRRGLEEVVYEGPYPLVMFMVDNDLVDWVQIVLPVLSLGFMLAELLEWSLLLGAVFAGRTLERERTEATPRA